MSSESLSPHSEDIKASIPERNLPLELTWDNEWTPAQFESLLKEYLPQWIKTRQKMYGVAVFPKYVEHKLGRYFKSETISTAVASQVYSVLQSELTLIQEPFFESTKEMLESMLSKDLLTPKEERDCLVAKSEGLVSQENLKKILETDSDISEEKFRFFDDQASQGIALQRELCHRNSRFLYKMVEKYWKNNNELDFDDLFLEGLEGLKESIVRFNIAYSNRLNTYSTWWIRLYVLKRIYKLNDIRLIYGIPVSTLYSEITRAVEHSFTKEHRRPSVREIVQFLGSKYEKEYRPHAIRQILRGELVTGRDEEFSSETQERYRSNFAIEDEPDEEEDVSQTVLLLKEKEALFDYFKYDADADLTPNEKELINIYVDAVTKLEPIPSDVEIGKDIGVTRQRVGQIKSSLVHRLSGLKRPILIKRLFKVNNNIFEVKTNSGFVDVKEYPIQLEQELVKTSEQLKLLVVTNYLETQNIEDRVIELIEMLTQFLIQKSSEQKFNRPEFAKFYAEIRGVGAGTIRKNGIQGYVPYFISLLTRYYKPEFAPYLHACIQLQSGKKRKFD